MSSTSNQALVAPGGLVIPRGIDICSVTLGLFEAFYRTKHGKMEEMAFALRFNTKLIIDNKPVTYYDTIAYLIDQCQSIMAKKPEEEAACLQLIESCEEMLHIANEPFSLNVNFLQYPFHIRNRVYEMVIGEPTTIVLAYRVSFLDFMASGLAVH